MDLATRAVATGGGSNSNTTMVMSQNAQGGSQANSAMALRRGEIVVVERVELCDRNGRFVVINTGTSVPGTKVAGSDSTERVEDDVLKNRDGEVRERWMLINTDPQSKSASSSRAKPGSRLAAVKPGVTVLIKGGEKMTWDLDLGFDGGVGGGRGCKVAVLWEVVGD